MWPTALTSHLPPAIEQALVPYDHASAAFQSLIQAIAESASREDERRIVSDECERLRTELAQPHQPATELAEMLIRAIYCEMFGAPAPFAIIPAMGLAQHPNPRAKQVGYTACALLLSPSHELMPLLQNTIHRDLGSPESDRACPALTLLTKLADSRLAELAAPLSLSLLEAPTASARVRVRAVGALMRCWAVAPHAVEALPGPPLEARLRSLLSEPSPPLVSAAAAGLSAMVRRRPGLASSLLPELLAAQSRLLGIRHAGAELASAWISRPELASPWLQLQLLALIGGAARAKAGQAEGGQTQDETQQAAALEAADTEAHGGASGDAELDAEQLATERVLCATLHGTAPSPLGQAIRAQAVRAAAQLPAPSEGLLRAMGAALCSLLGSPQPDVAYQGVRCVSSLLRGPTVFLALHTQPALVSLVAQRAELMAATHRESATADAAADADEATGDAASAADGAAGGGGASSPRDATPVLDELCACALEALLGLARHGASLSEDLRMLLELATLPAPLPLRTALLAAIGRAERLRWLSHADERAVAVGGEGRRAEGGAWLDGAPGHHYCVNVGCGVAAEQVLPIATVRLCTYAPMRLCTYAPLHLDHGRPLGWPPLSTQEAHPPLPLRRAQSLHAQALLRIKRRERESVAEAQELLTQALLIRDQVGSAADELERQAHLDVVSDLGVALVLSDSFEAARAMQERVLRMVQGREASYRGFVTQVHARLATLQRRQERFEQQRQRAAWLMESYGLSSQ